MIKFNELGINLNTQTLIIDASVRDIPYYKDVYIDSIYIDTDITYQDGGPTDKAVKVNPEIDLASIVYSIVPVEIEAGAVKCKIHFPITDIRKYIIKLDTYSASTLVFEDEDNNTCTFKHPHPGTTYNLFDFDGENILLITDSNDLEYFKSYFTDIKSCRIELDNTLLDNIENTMFFVYVKMKGTFGKDAPYNEDKPYELGITFNTYDIYHKLISNAKIPSACSSVSKYFIDYYLKFELLRACINNNHLTEAVSIYNKYFKTV